MARSFALAALLLIAAAANGSAQKLYSRPQNKDCIPATTTVSTFSAIFPSTSFLSGDSMSTSQGSTTVTVAKNFKVQYFPAYKVVTNTLTDERYILYQCGGDPPSGSVTRGAKLFEIPLTAVSVPDTVPYAFLEILNVTDRVQSVSSFAVAPCAQRQLACNKTAVMTSDLSNTTVLDSQVLPFVDGITATTLLDPAPPSDVPVFTFSASQDPGTLNRAEWVKFLGLFFNMEKAASDYFDSVATQYNATKAKSDSGNAASKPVVAWITHYLFAPDEYYQIDFAPYKVQYTQDAGGVMVDRASIAAIDGATVDAFTNTTYDFAWNGTQKGFATKAAARRAFLAALQDVDIVIDETYALDPTMYNYTSFLTEYGITNTSAQQLPFLNGTGSAVLREDGTVSTLGGLDWFEGAIARPAAVLADLAGAFAGPTSETRKFTWIRNIDQEPQVVGAANCTVPALESCTVTPTPICPLVKQCPDGSVVNLVGSSGCTYDSCDGSNAAAANSTAPDAAPAPAPGDQAASRALPAAAVAAAAAAAALLTAF